MKFFSFFHIIYDEVFAIQILAVSCSIVLAFYDWEKSKKNVAIGIARIVGMFALGTVLNWLLFALSTVWHFIGGIHFHIAWLLTIISYLAFCDNIRDVGRQIMGATLFVTVIATADLGREFVNWLENVYEGGYFKYICFISDAFLIVLSLVIRKYSLKPYSDVAPISIILIFVNAIASIALIICKTVLKITSGSRFDPYYCLVLAVVFLFSATSYIMIYFHCKERNEKTELEVQNKLLKADRQMLVVSEQAIEEMRSLRHDMKNQHHVMELMLKERKYDDLAEYFHSADKRLNQTTMSEFIDCGNQLVNSVINMEILKTASYGLKLATKISVPEKLPFESSDLCRVIVNLIDNAIEGVLRTEKRDCLIDVKIGRRAGYLYICVQNVIRDDIDREDLLKMNTVKEDTANHGYGHKIVKRIVEKYNGAVKYSVAENLFIAEVMLVLNEMEKI